MFKKEERSFVGSMTEKQEMWNRRAWKAMFLVGLLFIPIALFISMTSYPNAAIPKGWPSEALYWCGFYLSVFSFAEILRKEKTIGTVAVICGAVMVALSLTPTDIHPMIVWAGFGILAGGASIMTSALVNALRRRDGGGGKQTRQPPQPPTRKLTKALKGLTCVAILLLASNCIPGIHRLAIATTSSIPANSTTTVGGITIEVISDSKVKIYDALGTVIELEFNNSHIILNGTAIERPSLQPHPSEPNTGNPVGAAGTSGTFWWDGVQFAFGDDIQYCHPDRDYYGISPYSKWSKAGSRLLHYQLDEQTSTFALGSAAIMCGVIGLLIGTFVIGPPHGTVVGAIMGAVLGIYLLYVREYYMVDEKGCVWWWVSSSFIGWLVQCAPMLVALYIISPGLAISMTAGAFASQGYLLVGTIRFYDAIGQGWPTPPSDPVEPGHGIPPTRRGIGCGGSRTCMPL